MKPNENNPKGSQLIDAKEPYQPGKSPETDAWFTAFFIENHLDYFTYPDHAATPEQVRFMVITEEDERYYPCSDFMFQAIMNRKGSQFLQKQYDDVFQKILELIDQNTEDKWGADYLKSLVRIKFEHETRDEIMIPSRLEKRLISIFLRSTQIEDPYIFTKAMRNVRVGNILNSEDFHAAMNHTVSSDLASSLPTLSEIKGLVERTKLKRLFAMSVERAVWESDALPSYTKKDCLRIFDRRITGNGLEPLFRFLGIHENNKSVDMTDTKKILWLANEAGEVMVDLAIIKCLAKMGHKIIISFKEGPLFTKVDFNDAQEDETLKKELESVFWIKEKSLSKNQLIKILRSDNSIIGISDGTHENLNLILTSTTFARIFREVDGVISRGHDQKRRLFDTHFQFTQDIFNISEEDKEPAEKLRSVSICYKPKHPSVVKFSHKDLEKKAKTITDKMEEAKRNGMTVIFYSGIIGSIPGKIDMAKKIMSVFIDFLKKHLAMTFIINPSEHYESGMDADDLMYMWEIVQRSGLIDIWRFQTYGDISEAFRIVDKKVPPEWVGKDATFSTGCTKEMKIALEVQQAYPEMQIIGPSREKFMRRDEYGVGKMYDQRLSDIFLHS